MPPPSNFQQTFSLRREMTRSKGNTICWVVSEYFQAFCPTIERSKMPNDVITAPRLANDSHEHATDAPDRRG